MPLGEGITIKPINITEKLLLLVQKSRFLYLNGITPEEAFAEYKMMKLADLCRVSAMYKESVPDYIYERLLKAEVKPF